MLPILQREIVENKNWATADQLADYYAVGQCTPGVIAVNTATFVGYSQGGIAGGVCATLGVVTVPAFLILIIAAFLSNYMDAEIVRHAFSGIRAGVTALILASVVKLFKGAVTDTPTRLIYIAVLALAAAGTFLASPSGLEKAWGIITSPVFLVIISGLTGYIVKTVRAGGTSGTKRGGDK